MTTSNDPDVIRQQIEDTRADLGYDVDALNEKVNPARVVDRRVTRTKQAVDDLRGKVFGSDSSAGGVTARAHDAAQGVAQAPDAALSGTRGNPVAAGLIAFGVGWLVSSLLPTSDKEKQLAAQAEQAAQPLLENAKQVAQDAVQELQPAAQEALQSVQSTAQDAVQTVKDEGQSAAGDVQDQAQQAKETVQDQR
jgi:gas vesicle protein